MSLTAAMARMVREAVAGWPANVEQAALNNVLDLLAKWRSQMLANTYVQLEGRRVWGGPFAGMDYVERATEGALIARLLGIYESELHPHLAAFAAEGLDAAIDIGCAEGYYAVGLARMMPAVTVYAYDIDEAARLACLDMAARNGVADRVKVGGLFSPGDFEAFAGRRVLVLVDTEGAEMDILHPSVSPALAGMNLIVETHDVYRPGTLAALTERFAPTHEVVRVDQQPKVFEMPPFLQRMTHLDQLLAAWEWRQRPTPWLVMRPRRPA